MNKTMKILTTMVILLIGINLVLIYQLIQSRALFNPQVAEMLREMPPELRDDLVKKIKRYQLYSQKRNHWKQRRKLLRQWREAMLESQKEEIDRLKKLEKEVHDLLREEKIDTVRLFNKLDSLHDIRGRLNKKAIEFYIEQRGSIPPEDRTFILRNMFREPRSEKSKKWRKEK